MTRDEAMRLLDISREDHDPGVIHEAYTAQAAAVARRVASAPTSALREKFQQQADRLRQARSLLLSNAHPQYDSGDLPARGPIATGQAAPGAPEDGPARAGVVIGQVLADRYEVRSMLGSGGMGAVFAAFDRVRNEEITIKVLLPHLLADPKARERFLNEAKIASNLSHASIVRVHDIHQTPGLTFLTMERLRGRSLREELARRQQTAERFKVAEVLSIAGPLCEGLQYAHCQTVHRDVKPENIWLGEDGTVKLMDFGIARLLRPSQFTSTGLALGTAYYMAPEQLRGQEVDHRADQFALGVVLYELLTGEIPQGAIKPPHQLRRSVPARMSQAVMKSLEARPEARHADMAAFGRALTARYGSGVGTRAAVAAAVAILLGAIITFPVWRTWTDGSEGDPTLAPAASRATEAAFSKQWSQIAELKQRAEAVGTQIEADAKKSPGTVAEQVAEFWRRHSSQRKKWFAQAEKSLASAKGLAEKRSFDQAGAELKLAEAEYRKSPQWRPNACEAMESIATTRAAVQKQLDQFPADSTRLLRNWPEALTGAVEDKLLDGDGEEGLAEARRLAGRLPEVRKLLAQRRGVVEVAREAHDAARSDEFRPRYEAAEDRLQAADAALVKERMVDAGRIYTEAADAFRAVLAALNEQIGTLLARGKADLEAGRFAAAGERFQAVLKIRPGDAAAAQLARRAEIGGRLAQVSEHDRSGEREEAIAILAELRKLAPDDADVRVEVDAHVQSLLAKGKDELAAERFDMAAQEYRRVLKLRPGDATTTRAIQQVEMGRRIAEIKNLARSGDRAQALAALDNLRKRAPDDAEVKVLRDSIYDPRRAITNTVGMKLELIPAGEFLMGLAEGDREVADDDKVPQHRVRITRPFYLGAIEVTRGHFRQFVDGAGYRTEAERDGKGGYGFNGDYSLKGVEWHGPQYTWRNPGFGQTDEHPVVNVSWNDAMAFCAWLSRKERVKYRLPTEAEWEYACRAGTTTKYYSGDDPEGLAAVGNVGDGTAKAKYHWNTSISAQDGFINTAPAGLYRPNIWGLFDMHGNVEEWCSDSWAPDYYKRSPVNDPQGAEHYFSPVARGGGWFSDAARHCRSADRNQWQQNYRHNSLGFRVARAQSVR
jgi:formylglycine-generating enzyme required for sulfatase activity/serine/threonine protein kinase